MEVQYEAYELIKDLVKYEIKDDILQRLVGLLKPTDADIEKIPEVFSGMFFSVNINAAFSQRCNFS